MTDRIDPHLTHPPDQENGSQSVAPAEVALDRLARIAGECPVPPSPDARRMLHERWQHILVCPSWRDRALFWYREYLEPKVLTPLIPHAALIVGFVFLSVNLGMVQRYQFGVNLNQVLTRPAAEVVQAPPAAPPGPVARV